MVHAMPHSLGRVAALALSLFMTSLAGQEGVIIFTGSANGVYQNCLCPDKPLGGLERRAQFIYDIREKYPGALVLDAGDNFVEFLAEPVMSILVQGLELIQYDLINQGGKEEYSGGCIPHDNRDLSV